MKCDQWVTEAAHGFGLTVRTTELLYSAQSPYQKIEIYETEKVGKLLLLDGIVQLTEYDEFAYQEMMTHVPLAVHPNPEKILVIGGGDGGVLREIARHPEIRQIDICEIDAMVIEACQRFIPSLACGYQDPRVTVHVADGAEFVRQHPNSYDVVIVDSTDPVGPGEKLFNFSFYQSLKQVLRPGGVIASQAESLFLFPDVVENLLSITAQLFQYNAYGFIAVPTYPAGSIGVCVASDARDVTVPVRDFAPEVSAQLKYYNHSVHKGAFLLPEFGRQLAQKAIRNGKAAGSSAC